MRRTALTILLLALLLALGPLSAVGTSAAAPQGPVGPFQIEEVNGGETSKGEELPAYPIAPLGMTLPTETEPNDTAAAANALAGSQAVVLGNINPATDIDYFSFTANAGDRVYAATMTSFSNGGSSDTILDIIASDGTTVLETDDDSGSFSGTSSAIGGTVIPAAGTYYVRVDGFSATSPVTPYHLHVRVQSGTPTAEVEPNNDLGTANPMPASGWVSGTILATTDPDLFSFTLNAGDSVFIGLDMDPDRNPANTNWNGRVGLGVFDGYLLVANDSSTTKPHAEAFFMTAQEAGTYYAYVDSTSSTGLGTNARYYLSVSVYPKQVQSNCTTFTSSDVPKTIGPAVGTVTSTITVPGTVTSAIEDLNATIVLTHNLMADLDVTLLGPTGLSTPLFTDVGSSTAGTLTNMDIGLDDQAALPIGTFTVVRDIIYQPEQPGRLASFNGTPAGGTWTLQIADDTANNGGALQSWSLEVCGAPPPALAIELNKTVGLEPAVCATTDAITVPPGGFTVYYCYTVRNTGLTALTTHDLVDSELGTLFTGLAYTLNPGETYSHIQSATVDATVTNTATWTGHDAAGGSATDTDTATVNVPQLCPAGYRDVTVDATFFDNPFPPAGWTITNTSVSCTAPGLPDWTNTNPGLRTNLTGGAGLFAIADSDRCGSGSTIDAIMSTGLLDFTGLISPTVSFYTDYNDIATGGDLGLLDASTDGGATWANLFTWDADFRGPLLVTQALPGAGENDAMVRWHYAQGTYDWWWEVDDAFVTACEPLAAPAIAITKTVGTTAGVCATTTNITVAPGTTVYYCYEVANTGNVTLNLHDLVDDQLGTIFTGLNYALTPGSSVNTVAAGLSIPAVINATTVNTATWTAYNAGPINVATATASATVNVETGGGICPAGPEVGELAATDPVFNRPVGTGGSCTPSGVGTAVYYDVYSYNLAGPVPQQLFASLVGGATFDSVMVFYQATDGSANPFNPSLPCGNNVAYNDDFGSALQSQLDINTLGAGWVDVVVTTFDNGVTGPYTMDVSSSTCQAGPGADLSLVKTDSADPVTVGDLLTYTIAVTNNGPDAAANVLFTDTLPADFTFVNGTISAGSCVVSSGVITCSSASLASAGTITGVFWGTVDAATCPGTLSNTAIVTSDVDDPTPANNTDTEDTAYVCAGAPSITVAPAALALTVPQGYPAAIVQTLTISNTGTALLNWTITEDVTPAAEHPVDARVATAQAGRDAVRHVANPDAILITEGFEGGVIPPTGWTLVSQNASYTWQLHSTTPHTGLYGAEVQYDPALVPQSEWLLSPEQTITNGTLTFWSFGSLYWCRDTYDNCDLNVWLVVGAPGGGDDVFVGKGDAAWTETWVWAQSTFDITPLLPGGPVRIGFEYTGTDGAQIALDDILLDGTAGAACDAVSDIPWLAVNPAAGATAAGAATPVDVTYSNMGALAVGTYTASLCVNSDDPVNPIVPVPVTLTVRPPTAVDTTALAARTVAPLGLLVPVAGALLALVAFVILRKRRA